MPAETTELLYILGLTAFVSLTGVMLPGPVFAAAVAKGYEDSRAGIWIALGHGVVEFPLMAVLFLGLTHLAANQMIAAAVGAAGGAVLLYLGASMIGFRKAEGEGAAMPQHPLLLGVMTTASNPYFIIWWATVGLTLILMVYPFALVGFIAFAVVHWSCDLGWNGLVAAIVHRTRRFWSAKLRRAIFVIMGMFLAALGAWFIIDAARVLLGAT